MELVWLQGAVEVIGIEDELAHHNDVFVHHLVLVPYTHAHEMSP